MIHPDDYFSEYPAPLADKRRDERCLQEKIEIEGGCVLYIVKFRADVSSVNSPFSAM
jgi:hypothetical protein